MARPRRAPSVAVMRTASADAGPAVAFRDVVKVYNGRVTALDHVSFEIARGKGFRCHVRIPARRFSAP